MRTTSFLAPLFFAATGFAQGVEEGIAPSAPPPAGCEVNANGNFTIGTLKLAHIKRESAMEASDGALVCNLKNGVLRDSFGRTGSVVANHQFQFDGPPQAGAIYTGGFSICKNGSLAIGGTTQWWQCSSGPFFNLYDEWIGAQCEEIRIQAQLINQPSASPPAASSSLATPVASIVSSLATITGQVSTVSASAVGPTASLSSLSGNATVTSASLSGSSSGAASSTRASTSAGSSSPNAASSAAPAPPAGGAASASFTAGGPLFGAAMAFIGAALVL